MAKLTAKETRVLLESAKKIRTYRLMQAKGYQRLISKATDERGRQLLAELSANERHDAESWSQRIRQLAGGDRQAGKVSFLKQRVSLMMSVLGVRGFFEWSIIAEDGAVEDLALQAATIGDLATSEAWTRIASDERLHIEGVISSISWP